jgi:hypothetical protein
MELAQAVSCRDPEALETPIPNPRLRRLVEKARDWKVAAIIFLITIP